MSDIEEIVESGKNTTITISDEKENRGDLTVNYKHDHSPDFNSCCGSKFSKGLTIFAGQSVLSTILIAFSITQLAGAPVVGSSFYAGLVGSIVGWWMPSPSPINR